MKIAILADPVDNQNAGIHAFTIQMIEAMLRHRGKHEIILIREKKTDSFGPCRQYAIPNIRLPTGFATLRLFFIIPVLLRSLKVDAVIEPAHFGPFNLAASTRRITIIHDLTALLMPAYHRWHSQFLQSTFLPRILRQTDMIVTNSQYTSSDVIKEFPNEAHKIVTIPLGKDHTYIRDASTSELIRHHIDRPYFHFLGTLEPRKDLPTLLKAYQIIRSQRKNYSPLLVIAGGKGWKTEALFQEMESNPFKEDIRLLGRVTQQTAQQLHSHSLSLVYPSLYEGFGLPLLECLSCGGRVIASNNSSLPEVGGSLAKYFPTGDHEALARVMTDVLDQPITQEYSKKAIAWSDHFSWDKYALEMIRNIEGIEK